MLGAPESVSSNAGAHDTSPPHTLHRDTLAGLPHADRWHGNCWPLILGWK
jgi:hypothetical protein